MQNYCLYFWYLLVLILHIDITVVRRRVNVQNKFCMEYFTPTDNENLCYLSFYPLVWTIGTNLHSIHNVIIICATIHFSNDLVDSYSVDLTSSKVHQTQTS